MKELVLKFLGDIKNNYKTLILAFIISFGVWLVVSVNVFPMIENDIRGILIEAPITDYMANNNLQITGEIMEAVDIKIEGKRYDISDLKSSDFYASIDLSNVRSAGQYTVPITVSSKTNRELTISEVQPNMITLNIDRIISKEFVLRATAPYVTIPAEGYYMSGVTASPETITLTGSATVLNNIGYVEARSTFHGELDQSRQTNSELNVFGSFDIPMDKDGITFSTDNVTVNIPIYRQKDLPLTFSIINYPSNFDIDSLKFNIHPETLSVAAPDDSINNLSVLNIGTIDLANIQINRTTSFIPIVLPDGYINLSGNDSARIDWLIEDYSKMDFTISSANISVINPPDNYDVSLVTNQLALTVIGPSDKILLLSLNEFNATVNLLGTSLRTGVQDVSISVQIMGEDQTCWVSGQYKVRINAQLKE